MEIDEIPVDVAAILGSVELSMEDYSRLKKGDVLILEQEVTTPLLLRTGGQTRLKGYPGRLKENKALKIEGML